MAYVTPRDRRSRRLPCFFVIIVCIYLFVAFIIALHPHVFIKLASAHSFETNHTCNVAPRFVSCLLRGLLSDTLSLSTPLRPPLARVRKLFRTRPGLLLPLGPDHPQTSIKHLRFLVWTLYLFISRSFGCDQWDEGTPTQIST